MNIILRELRSNLKSLIIWCTSMILLIYVGMVKYSAMSQSKSAFEEMLESIPEVMKAAFGIGELDIYRIGGFYAIFFLYFVLLGGIHAVMLGATIISKEERDKTADFLFVKPVTREKIITSKIIAAIINIIILNLVTAITSIFFVDMYNTGDSITVEIIKIMMALFIIQMIFLSLGMVISALTKSVKRATSVSTAIILGTFMLSIAIDIYDKIENFKYFTPFKYFKANDLMMGKELELSYIILSLSIIVSALTTTYILYKRRDLHV
ncbi:MAG: ABC transporter permease subunit [Eubacteriaceae bacterium]